MELKLRKMKEYFKKVEQKLALMEWSKEDKKKMTHGYHYKGNSMFKLLFDPDVDYDSIFNWLIIASAGNPGNNG